MKKTNWVTMITPFTENGEVDYAAIDGIVEWYIENGVDGIFSVCQSSEMFFLTVEERKSIAKRVLQAADGRVPVVVSGHVSDTFEGQLAELKEMAEVGADALVLVTNRLAAADEGDEIWIENAQRLLDALPGVKFGLYECPYPYKRLLSEKTLLWCADKFIFLKDTCCDLELIKHRIALLRGKRLKLYNANTSTLLESLRAGADGFCGIMLNFHPSLYSYLLANYDKHTEKTEAYARFATVASFIERQLYPVNAKYNISFYVPGVTTVTRSHSNNDFTPTFMGEVRQLDELWRMLRDKF